MPRVALHSLGCKVNQYETQKIAEDFRARGFDQVGFLDEADVYVINTCTVTQTADSKSRHAARSAVRRNPEATVVVTGCYAETSPEQLREIDGVTMVVGNREKPRLAERVTGELQDGMVEEFEGTRETARRRRREPGQTKVRGRTRALLKIQDGCDQFCAYCVVPFARPVMESRSYAEVQAEAEDLAGRGFKEIVLTGIRLGCYEDGLTNLMAGLASVSGIERIRLSSIELTDIPEGLLDLMAREDKVCRHLHVPLQSGDDRVLASMNRPYTAEEFASLASNARSVVPGIAITTDIMAGFPGETAEEFENTYRFAGRMRFARTHVFRYSPRPYTAAARLADDVSAGEKDRRRNRLTDLAANCSHEFAGTLVGQIVRVLTESKEIGGKLRSGLSDNYVRVAFEAGLDQVGRIAEVRVESVSMGIAWGMLVA